MYISHPKEKKKYKEERESLNQIFNLTFSTYLGLLISQIFSNPFLQDKTSKQERKPKVVLNNFSSKTWVKLKGFVLYRSGLVTRLATLLTDLVCMHKSN